MTYLISLRYHLYTNFSVCVRIGMHITINGNNKLYQANGDKVSLYVYNFFQMSGSILIKWCLVIIQVYVNRKVVSWSGCYDMKYHRLVFLVLYNTTKLSLSEQTSSPLFLFTFPLLIKTTVRVPS